MTRRAAGYSTRTFARRFVAEVGSTPPPRLTDQRLLEARRLRDATELPIEEVACRCGLGTAANLRLQLARDASITPTAYRNAFRGHGMPDGTLSASKTTRSRMPELDSDR
jgi:transcriptional regulator GlxA family with amidase domain